MIIRILLIVMLAGLLTGCDMVKSVDKSGDTVDRFHTLYNAGDMGALYDELASARFVETQPREKFVSLMSAVYKRLGQYEHGNRTSFNIHRGLEGTRTSLIFNARFTNGDGRETFMLVTENGAMKLQSYNISAKALQVVPDRNKGEIQA